MNTAGEDQCRKYSGEKPSFVSSVLHGIRYFFAANPPAEQKWLQKARRQHSDEVHLSTKSSKI
jgi:hypothetical protein